MKDEDLLKLPDNPMKQHIRTDEGYRLIPIDWERISCELYGHLLAIEAHSKHEDCSDNIKENVKKSLEKYAIMSNQMCKFQFNNTEQITQS